MPLLLLVVQEAAHAGGEEGFTPFSINTGLIFLTIVVFGILLVLLWKLGLPALLKSVEERQRRIQHQLEDAEQVRAQAVRRLSEHKRAIARPPTGPQHRIASARAGAA